MRDSDLPPELAAAFSYAERLACKMVPHPNDREDAAQAGRIGAWVAWQRYDRRQGAQFATYAHRYIRGCVLRWLRDTAPGGATAYRVRHGDYFAEWAQRLQAGLLQDLQEHHPADWQLRPLPEWPEYLQEPVRLNAFQVNAEGQIGRLGDTIPARPEPDRSLWNAVRQVLELQDERLLYVIERRFRDGCLQSEIAPELGLSQMQISRLERQALALLREEFTRPI